MEKKLNELLRGQGYQIQKNKLLFNHGFVYCVINEDGDFLKHGTKGELLEMVALAAGHCSKQTEEKLQDWVETLF